MNVVLTERQWAFSEAAANVLSGFILVPLAWLLVITPMLDLQLTLRENVAVILILAHVSLLRSYIWRRFFNWIRTSPTT